MFRSNENTKTIIVFNSLLSKGEVPMKNVNVFHVSNCIQTKAVKLNIKFKQKVGDPENYS